MLTACHSLASAQAEGLPSTHEIIRRVARLQNPSPRAQAPETSSPSLACCTAHSASSPTLLLLPLPLPPYGSRADPEPPGSLRGIFHAHGLAIFISIINRECSLNTRDYQAAAALRLGRKSIPYGRPSTDSLSKFYLPLVSLRDPRSRAAWGKL